MPKKLPVNDFKWVKDTSQFNEDFIEYYNEESDDGYFKWWRIYHFYLKDEKLKNSKSF